MKKFYVVGTNTSKSLSPVIFNYWFKKYQIKAKYSYLELSNRSFDKKIKDSIENKNIHGLNITIPFKQKIMKHVNVFDTHSKKINAVNCVSIKSTVFGANTDWEGYYKTLPKIKNIKKKEVLIIGYGGAALAIHYVLLKKGFKKIHIVNRTKKKISFVKKTEYTKPTNTIGKYLKTASIIINTTPTNPIDQKNKKLINKNVLLSDIVYYPKETPFLKSFPYNKKIYGIEMLLEQAALCFKLWFGFIPKADPELKRILNNKIK